MSKEATLLELLYTSSFAYVLNASPPFFNVLRPNAAATLDKPLPARVCEKASPIFSASDNPPERQRTGGKSCPSLRDRQQTRAALTERRGRVIALWGTHPRVPGARATLIPFPLSLALSRALSTRGARGASEKLSVAIATSPCRPPPSQ